MSNASNEDVHKGTKINIHFPLRGNLANFCIQLNQDIQKLIKSDIDFSNKSFHIPHLTLYMGYINNVEDFIEVLEKLHVISQKLRPQKFNLSSPYLKEPKLNYVFVDTDFSSEIITLKSSIKELCDTNIQPLEWNVVAEKPHITLAYIKEDFKKVNEYLKSVHFVPALETSAIEISFCGIRGTCVGAIKSFEYNYE